jgi:hypothetical protein
MALVMPPQKAQLEARLSAISNSSDRSMPKSRPD